MFYKSLRRRSKAHVSTVHGSVVGFQIHSHYTKFSRHRINVFLCIPYAKRLSQYDDWRRDFRFRNGAVGNLWGPVVDGPISGNLYGFLNENPKTMREQASFKKFKIMAGINKDKGSMFIPNLKTLEEGVSPVEFSNIAEEFLYDRNVKDMTNIFDALKFQYTYWPQPRNYTFGNYYMVVDVGNVM